MERCAIATPTLYVHAVHTSGAHRNERRRYGYAARCSQCGVELTDETHVAAHVVEYACPLCVPCTGRLKLVTTCRACNSAHQADGDDEPCLPRRARFWRARRLRTGADLRRRVWRMWCWRYKYRP